jgi:hypothetical protein
MIFSFRRRAAERACHVTIMNSCTHLEAFPEARVRVLMFLPILTQAVDLQGVGRF